MRWPTHERLKNVAIFCWLVGFVFGYVAGQFDSANPTFVEGSLEFNPFSLKKDKWVFKI